jgi:lysophospholipase L1-like esterase
MKTLLLLFFISNALQVYGQNDKKFTEYYYHKKAHFESLPNTEDEIIFLGNSITDGCEWSELFQDLRIKNRGISGDNTEGVLYRLREVTDSKPLKIFIMIGINDLSQGLSLTQILYNYENIIKSIKSMTPKTKVYVQSILPINPEFSHYKTIRGKTQEIIDLNSDLQKLAQINNVEFIDLFSVFNDGAKHLDKKYTQDGLHLNGEGYLLWKKTIEHLVK